MVAGCCQSIGANDKLAQELVAETVKVFAVELGVLLVFEVFLWNGVRVELIGE